MRTIESDVLSFLEKLDQPKRPNPKAPSKTATELTPYGRGVLDHKCAEMATTPEGRREETLRDLGRLVGGYIAGGDIPYRDGHDRLREAALASGLTEREVDDRLTRHLEYGMTEPLAAPPRSPAKPPETLADTPNMGPRLWKATDLKPAAQRRWLARNRIQQGAINLLIGDEGIGKSLLWVWVAAAVTTGKPLEGFGIPARDPGRVIVIVTEDDWSTTVLPRLIVAGADLDMIDVICTEDDGSGAPEFPRDLHLITDDAKLVVVDAWMDTVPSKLQVQKPQDARQALHPWKEVATKTDAAILLLTHTNRTSSAKARDKYGNTGELRKIARMALFAQVDDDGRLLVGPDKSNNSRPIAASTFAIRAIQHFHPTDEDDGTVPQLVYAGESDRTAGQHIADAYEDDKGDVQDRNAAERWLTEYLQLNPGEKSAEVKREAKKAGISERTLARARNSLGVTISYTGTPPVSMWTLA